MTNTEAEAIAEKVRAEIDAGEYECPSCGEKDGLVATVSCMFCGHVPEEVRDR